MNRWKEAEVNHDWIGLLWTYLFLFGVVLAGEGIRRFKRWPSEFTRKCIHIGVGFWGFIAFSSIQNMWIVLIPPLSFVFINFLSYKWTLLPSMEIEDKRNLGTVYYPLSICVLIILFWRGDTRIVPVLGSMIMGLGDGFASIIGRKWGRRVYRVWRHPKTLEGSLAMLVFAWIAAASVLLLMTGLPLSAVLIRSSVLAALAASIEGASPWGLDNLTVPLLSGLAYRLLFL
jgi:dolichol kinase